MISLLSPNHVIKALMIAAILAFIAPLASSAQTDSAGVRLIPALIGNEEIVNPGEQKTYDVQIQNTSQREQTYYLFTRDIEGVEQGGQPVFARPGAEKTGYEISEWITLGSTEVTVASNEQANVRLEVRVPDSASPGGHFGALFVSQEPPEDVLRGSGALVGFQVASIISLRVAGDVVEDAMIRSFTTDQLIYGSAEVSFNAEIENKGNVLVRPTGLLSITNMLGEEVAQVRFNDDRAGVFPGSRRTLSYLWEDDRISIGQYTAKISLLYGSEEGQRTMTSEVSFWVLPGSIIWPALGVLAAILLITYVAINVYVRSAVEQATGNRRVVRRKRRGRGVSVLLMTLVILLSITALFLIILLALFA